MSRKFISLVVASAVAVTAFTSAPARAASDEDIAKILGAAATLFILGKAIESHNDGKKSKSKATVKTHSYKSHSYNKSHSHKKTYTKPKSHSDKRMIRRPQTQKQHIRHGRAPLPSACLRTVETRKGTRNVFGARCLSRNYKSARQLPQSCLREVRTNRGWRNAYVARCMQKNGYRISRR